MVWIRNNIGLDSSSLPVRVGYRTFRLGIRNEGRESVTQSNLARCGVGVASRSLPAGAQETNSTLICREVEPRNWNI